MSDLVHHSARFVRTNGAIAGVASGLARDFKLDVVLVRIAWVVAVCMGFGFFLYVACWIAFPPESDATLGNRKRLLGVCWRIAERSSQPVGMIRLASLGLLCISGGTAVVGYVLALLILPQPEQKQVQA